MEEKKDEKTMMGTSIELKPRRDDDCMINRVVVVKGRRKFTKWMITILLAAAAFLDPITYTMIYPALPQLPASLNTTQDLANLSTTLSLIGPALVPLYWSFVAESQGRRVVLLLSFALYTLFTGLAAAATSIGVLIAMRVLASFFSCGGTIAGAAVVADIWPSEVRGFAMSIYYLGPMTGPALGPVIGGVLAEVWDWRAVLWFLTVYAGVIFILMIFLIPETLEAYEKPIIVGDIGSHKTSFFLRAGRQVHRIAITPLANMSFLRFPAISVTVLIASICFAAVMMGATTLQEAFHQPPYNYNYIIVGLLYLPMAIGLIIGGLLSGKWSDVIMAKDAKKSSEASVGSSGGILRPETRLKENAWISILVLPIALIIYGWTLQYGVLWVAPMVGWFLVGFSTGLMFSLVATVLTELVPQKAASLVALNAMGRNSFGAVSSSITQPLATRIGIGWSYTGMAIFTLFNIIALASFQRYGRVWRESTDRKSEALRSGSLDSLNSQIRQPASLPEKSKDAVFGGNECNDAV